MAGRTGTVIRPGTLEEVADDGTFSVKRLRVAWRLLELPERVDRKHAVAATIVSVLVGDDEIGDSDRAAAKRVLELIDTAWAKGLPPAGLCLVWSGGQGCLTEDPYEVDPAGTGAAHVYDLRQWTTGM